MSKKKRRRKSNNRQTAARRQSAVSVSKQKVTEKIENTEEELVVTDLEETSVESDSEVTDEEPEYYDEADPVEDKPGEDKPNEDKPNEDAFIGSDESSQSDTEENPAEASPEAELAAAINELVTEVTNSPYYKKAADYNRRVEQRAERKAERERRRKEARILRELEAKARAEAEEAAKLGEEEARAEAEPDITSAMEGSEPIDAAETLPPENENTASDVEACESEESTAVGRKISIRSDSKVKKRITAIVAATLFTLIVAVIAGLGLALWDVGITPSNAVKLFAGSNVNAAVVAKNPAGPVTDAGESAPVSDDNVDMNEKKGELKEFSFDSEVELKQDSGEKSQGSAAAVAAVNDSVAQVRSLAVKLVESGSLAAADFMNEEGAITDMRTPRKKLMKDGRVLSNEIQGITTLVEAGIDGEVLYEADEVKMENALEMSDSVEMFDDSAAEGVEELEYGEPSGIYNEIPSMGGIPQNVEYSDPDANYPLPMGEVDLSYFDDALFIGDSRMLGFGMYSGTNATFYAAVGFQLYKYETAKIVQTDAGKVPIFSALPYDAFTKIYIKVGLNEMGWGNEEMFEQYYAELIARLRKQEPRAIIYIHGLLPVTAWKSAEDSTHNNPNIFARNEALKAFAQSQKAYYVEVNSVVSDEDGSLKSDYAGDGIHMSGSHMDLWREYLRTHAVIM